VRGTIPASAVGKRSTRYISGPLTHAGNQNGIDQQLTAEIEGATIDTEYSSKSTSYGRCYSFKIAPNTAKRL